MDLLRQFFDAQWTIGDQHLLWRDIIGNLFGLASAVGGMRRKVWAWPTGIVGNLILLTVFLGAVFDNPGHAENLLGQASRQAMFLAVSVYGWIQWRRTSASGQGAPAVIPHWATSRERVFLAGAMVGGTVALTPLFRALGSWEPVWADAWIFMGSLMATYGMARGWVEFWLVWIAVDLVGVPLLLSKGFYASGIMFMVYGIFVIVGFFTWWRAQREGEPHHAARERDGSPEPR